MSATAAGPSIPAADTEALVREASKRKHKLETFWQDQHGKWHSDYRFGDTLSIMARLDMERLRQREHRMKSTVAGCLEDLLSRIMDLRELTGKQPVMPWQQVSANDYARELMEILDDLLVLLDDRERVHTNGAGDDR